MSKLFIYYSYYGSGDVVANYLQEKGYEIRKVESKLKLSKVFLFAMLGGGFKAVMNKKPKLINYDSDVSSYDEIVIGSPIWNDRLAPAINSVLKQTNLSNKKLTFVFYSGSGFGKHATNKVIMLYNALVINLKEPKKYKDELKKLEEL
jgi:hypothetical protein